jgi:hypothetical protein
MTERLANISEQFLGNGSINTFPLQRIYKQQPMYCWAITRENTFSIWFVPKCYKQSQSSSRGIAGRQFSTGVGGGRT